MSVHIVMWLPWSRRVPPGWQTIRQRRCHYHLYGRLIEKTTTKNKRKRRP